jgi:hypothetical protein
MASQISALITKFTQGGFYPECDATIAESLFNDVYKEILLSLQLRTNTVTVNLTAGTGTYDLSENIIRIHEVLYQASASSTGEALTHTSLAEMRILCPNYAQAGQGTPLYAYTTSATDTDSGKMQLGLYPVPNVSTSGTYPRVVLHVTQYAVLSGTETLPNAILTDDLFLYGMSYKWAVRQDPEKVAYWHQLYNQEMLMNQDRVNRTLIEAPLGKMLSPWLNRQSSLR